MMVKLCITGPQARCREAASRRFAYLGTQHALKSMLLQPDYLWLKLGMPMDATVTPATAEEKSPVTSS